MNRSDEIMERNERIFDGIILRAESFCPKCKALLMEAIQEGSESCGTVLPNTTTSYDKQDQEGRVIQ